MFTKVKLKVILLCFTKILSKCISIGGCSLDRENQNQRERHVYQPDASHSPGDSPQQSMNEQIITVSKIKIRIIETF